MFKSKKLAGLVSGGVLAAILMASSGAHPVLASTHTAVATGQAQVSPQWWAAFGANVGAGAVGGAVGGAVAAWWSAPVTAGAVVGGAVGGAVAGGLTYAVTSAMGTVPASNDNVAAHAQFAFDH